MKRTEISVALTVALGMSSLVHAQAPSDTARVRQAVMSFFDALNTHKFDSAAQFVADDWQNINAFGVRVRGRDSVLAGLERVHATILKDVVVTVDETDVRFAAPSVALVTVKGHASTFTSPDGVKHENERRIRGFVVVKRNDRWLILQDQSTTITRP
jgi:uncharacterized protein (TIGR02246 family)